MSVRSLTQLERRWLKGAVESGKTPADRAALVDTQYHAGVPRAGGPGRQQIRQHQRVYARRVVRGLEFRAATAPSPRACPH